MFTERVATLRMLVLDYGGSEKRGLESLGFRFVERMEITKNDQYGLSS